MKYVVAHLSMILFLSLYTAAQPLAEGRDKFLGVGTSHFIHKNLDKYWNQVTPGNAGKWGSVEFVQGEYNWTNLDTIYNYALSKNIPFKEHVLVWGSQQPSWLSSLDSASQRSAVEKWIDTVGKRYPQMAFVDVVNEPFHNPLPVYMNALGGTGKTGWDWVVTAFQWARRYCAPGVKLILNEYNVLHDNTVTTNYLRLIDTLKVRGLIDGIGIQGHYFEFRSDLASANQYVYSISTIRSNLDRLAATGIPVYITEFDIDEPIDSNQVNQYKIYFPIFWRHPGVKGITLWGYYEDDVWNAHPDTYVLKADGRERPALQWLRTFILSPAPPVLKLPVTATKTLRNPRLVWSSSDSATSYRVQVSEGIAFAVNAVDSSVTDTLLQLAPLDSNKKYYWRVSAANNHGASEFSAVLNFTTSGQTLGVKEIQGQPTAFRLYQNYPNPFNPVTVIQYEIPFSGFVSLKLYNILGQETATLFEGVKQPGIYEVRLNAGTLTGGIYFYRLHTGKFSSVKKLTIVK